MWVFYIVCNWLREFVLFRDYHLPSVHLLDGVLSVSWSTSHCSTCSSWALVDLGSDEQKKKEANLRNLLFFCLFAFCPPLSPMSAGVSSGRGWSSALWSVGVGVARGFIPCTHSPPPSTPTLRHCRCPIIKSINAINNCKHTVKTAKTLLIPELLTRYKVGQCVSPLSSQQLFLFKLA